MLVSVLGTATFPYILTVTDLAGPLWAWTVVEPAMGIVCACLPTVGGPFVNMIVKTVTMSKPAERNDSADKNTSTKTIATMAGSSAKPRSRPGLSRIKGENGTGSFEQLNDDSGHRSPTDLWPEGYRGGRDVIVSGGQTPSEHEGDILLTSITIKQEMSWTESKAAS